MRTLGDGVKAHVELPLGPAVLAGELPLRLCHRALEVGVLGARAALDPEILGCVTRKGNRQKRALECGEEERDAPPANLVNTRPGPVLEVGVVKKGTTLLLR